MTDNNTWLVNLDSPIYSTLLQNRFLIWGLFLCIWGFGRPRDQRVIWWQWYTPGVLGRHASTRESGSIRQLSLQSKFLPSFRERYSPPNPESASIGRNLVWRNWQVQMGRRYNTSSCPFYWYRLIWISAWISNHKLNKVCDEITNPIPNFNCCIFGVWEWISNSLSQIIMGVITYPCWD